MCRFNFKKSKNEDRTLITKICDFREYDKLNLIMSLKNLTNIWLKYGVARRVHLLNLESFLLDKTWLGLFSQIIQNDTDIAYEL